MRSTLLALIWAVFACACLKGKPPPPPPASLVAAITAADSAVNKSGGVEMACEELSRELSTYKSLPGVPVRTQADLHRLIMEIAAYGATNDDPMGQRRPDTQHWKQMRDQLDRVLMGQNPSEGPRYQIDMPQNVKAAVDEVDAALSRDDLEGAKKELSKLHGPLSEWATKMPGPRGARLMGLAEEELYGLTMVPGGSAAQFKASWERVKRRMQPGGGEE